MSCKRIQKRIPLFVGGDLDLRDSTEVEVHLERCLSCYREATLLREPLAPLRAMREDRPALPDGDDFLRGVMSQVEGPPPQPQTLRRLALAGGWAAAGLVAALWFTRSDDVALRDVVDEGQPARALVVQTSPASHASEALPADAEATDDFEWLEAWERDSGMGDVVKRRSTPVRTAPALLRRTDVRDF